MVKNKYGISLFCLHTFPAGPMPTGILVLGFFTGAVSSAFGTSGAGGTSFASIPMVINKMVEKRNRLFFWNPLCCSYNMTEYKVLAKGMNARAF